MPRTHDLAATQLKDLAKQGISMARLAHFCAAILVLLFSAGSLVALGGDALASIFATWNTGSLDIPSTISLAVSTLLVACMDVGMVYAASMLRLLTARRADPQEKRLHQAVLFGVAILEAGTYLLMSARYEHPISWPLWLLIVARALTAPLLSVYLSLARPLPVTSRDILAHVELASGQGVIREAITIANDPQAPFNEKVALFAASAQMVPSDRARLDALLATLAATPLPLRAPNAEVRMSRALARNPNASLGHLAQIAQVSKSTAKKYRDRQLAA